MSRQGNEIPMVTATLVEPESPVDPRGRSTNPTLSGKEMQILKDQGFTTGLIRDLQRNAQAFPMRIWIVDNSGTFNTFFG